ncbi:MAG: hypothetical protein ACREB9_04820, partial [Thermoplasmata archaeon]
MPKPIIGGLVRRKVVPPRASPNVTVSWKWYDQGQGLVEWTFTNNSAGLVAFVLYRNDYLFCGWAGAAVYASNPEFGVNYASEFTAMPDNGAENNSGPLGIVRWPDGTPEVCFTFMLGPTSSWSQIEGGFTSLSPPSGAAIYELSAPIPGTYCIGYSADAVTQWNKQTGDSLSGGPNPQAWPAIAWSLPAGVPKSIPSPVTVTLG